MRPFLLFTVMLLIASDAAACPYCDSDIGRQVSARIFADDFWQNLLIGAVPFPLLFGLVALVQFSGGDDE